MLGQKKKQVGTLYPFVMTNAEPKMYIDHQNGKLVPWKDQQSRRSFGESDGESRRQ